MLKDIKKKKNTLSDQIIELMSGWLLKFYWQMIFLESIHFNIDSHIKQTRTRPHTHTQHKVILCGNDIRTTSNVINKEGCI